MPDTYHVTLVELIKQYLLENSLEIIHFDERSLRGEVRALNGMIYGFYKPAYADRFVFTSEPGNDENESTVTLM